VDGDQKDIDAKLGAESRRLLSEMNKLIERGRLLLRDRQQALAGETPQVPPGTLGAVLYAKPSQPLVPEKEWVALVRAIASRDQLALHALYERVHDPVRMLVGDLTIDVLHEVWRRADQYHPADGTVLAWIMNIARARALNAQRETRASDASLPPQVRLAHRIASDTGGKPMLPPQTPQWSEPAWEQVAPGISVKLLASDAGKHMVSMLVRLAPGTDYPPHDHAGVEELHLLEGELWIDERKLYPGAYNRAEPGTADKRVWSETGCMCVLVTSTLDVLH
jgi:DNA-directed RNA polymerase specialized sigma24 family protein